MPLIGPLITSTAIVGSYCPDNISSCHDKLVQTQRTKAKKRHWNVATIDNPRPQHAAEQIRASCVHLSALSFVGTGGEHVCGSAATTCGPGQPISIPIRQSPGWFLSAYQREHKKEAQESTNMFVQMLSYCFRGKISGGSDSDNQSTIGTHIFCWSTAIVDAGESQLWW